MEKTDKVIEIVKAAMEKENGMKDNAKEAMDQNIDTEQEMTEETLNQEVSQASPEEKMEGDETSKEGESESTEKQEKAGKSFFKNKNKELAAKDQKIEELTDRLMRSMAEFENYRKRTEKEKTQMYDMGVKSMIEKILPIIDNFERGFSTLTDKDKEGAFAQGIELIYKQLIGALEEIGVKPIDAVGKEFDPNFHNAVMHGEDEALGENIISDEFQKGYMYKDTVVRYSMVKVVN